MRSKSWTMRVETIERQTRATCGCRQKSVSAGLGCTTALPVTQLQNVACGAIQVLATLRFEDAAICQQGAHTLTGRQTAIRCSDDWS